MSYRRFLLFLSGAICLILFMNSCDDNPSSAKESPPQVPPAATMSMDFSEFSDQQKTQSQNQSAGHFRRAVGTAVIMKTVADLNLAIPRALLKAANKAEPEFNDEGQWEWNYVKNTDDKNFSVRLLADRESEDQINWSFYVTNSRLGLENHLFFNGTTNSDGSQGVWSYYRLENTDGREQVSEIEWTVNGEDDVELRLEVTSDRNDRQGDYLEYMFDGTIKSVAYYDNSEDQEVRLQINVDSKVGFIIAPDYNDGNKACWDDDFQDVSCSEI